MTFRIWLTTALSCLALPALACSPSYVEIKSDAGQIRFEVDVADDELERANGLMHVAEMAPFKGMLFIYEQPLRAAFWMKNTLIPLDMLFADPTGTITKVHPNAVPLSEETIDGGENVLYVLEINGGMAARLGIKEGAVMQHPAFDQNLAAWACAQ